MSRDRYAVEVEKGSVHTLQECADFLRVSYGTVYKMARKGKLATFKVGNNYRVTGETLIKLTGGK